MSEAAGGDAGVGGGGAAALEPLAEGGGSVVGLAGAGGAESDPFESGPRCTSGRQRDPDESEGPEMNPGFPCIFCHGISNSASGEADAPIFAFAGTLYASAHEPNNCVGGGADSAEVVVEDSSGLELLARANRSGNFLLTEPQLAPPFWVKVLFEGRERRSATPHTQGDCNLCHTEAGAQGAPGRVVLP